MFFCVEILCSIWTEKHGSEEVHFCSRSKQFYDIALFRYCIVKDALFCRQFDKFKVAGSIRIRCAASDHQGNLFRNHLILS